jgi:hypothetical protein
MFNDMALSSDINEKFKEYLEVKSLSNGLDFNILILTAGSWPLTAQAATFNVPQEVRSCCVARWVARAFRVPPLTQCFSCSRVRLDSSWRGA